MNHLLLEVDKGQVKCNCMMATSVLKYYKNYINVANSEM